MVKTITLKMMQDFCDRTDRDFPVPVKEQPFPSGGMHGSFDLDRFLLANGINVKSSSPWQGGMKHILDACVFDSSHVGTSAAIIQMSSGALVYSCKHDSCDRNKWEDVRAMFDPDYRSGRDNVIPMRSASAVAPSNGKAHTPVSDFELAYDFANRQVNEVPYLVERLLAAGGTFAVIAKPKVGKSTLALSLSLAVARGDDFLGRTTRQGSVLYVALEGSAGEWRRVLLALGVQPDDAFHFFHGKRPEAVGPWLRAAVDKYQPVLIVFDTLQRLVKVKDISDYAALSNATDDFIELARSSGATLGFLHHGGKSEKSDPIDSPLGSTAIGGAVDALLYLKRGATNRTLQTVQRDGHDLPETIVAMDSDTHHVSLGGTKAEADERDVSRAIEDYLAGLAEPIVEAVILENVEGRKSLKQAALRRLVVGGAVTRSGAGKSGSPYLYASAQECLPPLPPTIGGEVEKQTFETDEKARQIEVLSTSGGFHGSQKAGGSPEADMPEPVLPSSRAECSGCGGRAELSEAGLCERCAKPKREVPSRAEVALADDDLGDPAALWGAP